MKRGPALSPGLALSDPRYRRSSLIETRRLNLAVNLAGAMAMPRTKFSPQAPAQRVELTRPVTNYQRIKWDRGPSAGPAGEPGEPGSLLGRATKDRAGGLLGALIFKTRGVGGPRAYRLDPMSLCGGAVGPTAIISPLASAYK